MLIGGSVLFFLTRAWIFPTNLELPAWIIIAVIVIIGTVVGFSVFLESVKYIGPVKSTLLGCLEPALATSEEKKENGELFTEEVIKNIIEEFSLSDEEAEKYMKMYW